MISSFLHYQHIPFKSICQQLFLVVSVRVELTLDPYERPVQTTWRHRIKKPSKTFIWRVL